MQANVGDRLIVHGRQVGQVDHAAEVVEVLGTNGEPPYRVRYADGHVTILWPGPDTEIRRLSTTG